MKVNGPLSKKQELINLAFKLSRRWWVDVLEPGEISRKLIEMPYYTIYNKLNKKCFVSVKIRQRFSIDEKYDIEVAFATNTNPDYIFWALLDFNPSNVEQIFNLLNS